MVYARQLMPYAPYAASVLYGSYGRARGASAYKRSYSRTMTQKKTQGGARTSFKKMVAATLPSKQFTSQLTRAFTHNTIFTANMTAGITQGDLNSSRTGDSITLSSLKLMGSYFSDAVGGAYTFRILVGYSGEEYASTTFASGLGATEIFLPNTTTTFSTLGVVNPKAFTVLSDQTVDLNSQIAAVVDVHTFSVNVNLKQSEFVYQASGSAFGKSKNLYVVVLACVGGGTSGTTDAGDLILSCDLIYK